MALLFGLSSMSRPPVPALLARASDKLLHLLAYAGLGLCFAWGLRRSGYRLPGWKAVVIVTLLALGYGISDEIHQLFVPGRSFELADMGADMAGGFVGALALWVWTRLRGQP